MTGFILKFFQNGVETQVYYYGARYYDPKMSLFVSVDPLAEQFQGWSPYNYTLNNPLRYTDPTGMAPEDIYRFDKKSGELVLEIKTNDDFDQIGSFKYDKKSDSYNLKTNKDGSSDILVDNIAKGILKDGLNFKERNNVIQVNGPDQPTETDFQNFIVDYTRLAGVEISGYALGNNPRSNDISAFLVEAHKNNTFDSSVSARYNENATINRGYLKGYFGKSVYAKQHYHTHPDNSLSSRFDQQNSRHKSIPHFIFSNKYNQQYNERGVFETKKR